MPTIGVEWEREDPEMMSEWGTFNMFTNYKSFSDRTVEQNKEDRECNAREMNALQIAT